MPAYAFEIRGGVESADGFCRLTPFVIAVHFVVMLFVCIRRVD